MIIDEATVNRIAHLARLAIKDSDMPVFTDSLSKVFTLLEQVNAIDTGDCVPMAHPLEGSLRMRDDVVTESNQREEFLRIAPNAEAGLFLVPAVIE